MFSLSYSQQSIIFAYLYINSKRNVSTLYCMCTQWSGQNQSGYQNEHCFIRNTFAWLSIKNNLWFIYIFTYKLLKTTWYFINIDLYRYTFFTLFFPFHVLPVPFRYKIPHTAETMCCFSSLTLLHFSWRRKYFILHLVTIYRYLRLNLNL